jgi:class 3 adenylate cyclase/DNA-binding SARP family transcriptional activator
VASGLPNNPAPALIIRLLGPFEVRLNGDLPRFRYWRSQWLLALLALRHEAEVERDWLTALLWPESRDTQALRNCLTDLRRALGSEAARLQAPTPHTLRMDLTGAAVDVIAFDAAIAQGDPASLAEAVALYQATLLEGCAEEWAFEERQRRELAYLAARERLAALALESGDAAAAEQHLRLAVAVDPLRESTQRALMQALVGGGNYNAAAQVYQELRRWMRQELNAEPDPETQAVFQQLRAEARHRSQDSGLNTEITRWRGYPRHGGGREGRKDTGLPFGSVTPKTMKPQTEYARSGDIHIAYQVLGDSEERAPGANDLIFIPPFVSNVEYIWEEPSAARFLRRLASFSRLIHFDKRGTGLSDRVSEVNPPTLEERIDDIRAIMDQVGSERTAIFGHSDGGPLSLLFAATYPDRVLALITFGTSARTTWAPDYPWATTREQREEWLQQVVRHWGQAHALRGLAGSMADDERFMQWLATYSRLGASPSAALALGRMNTEIDVRHILPAIRVPTLVLHRTGDGNIENARYLTDHIPTARFVELPGADHLPFVGDSDALLDQVEEFLTGVRPVPRYDRVLATLLFTEIAGSTARAAQIGDARWKHLLESHGTLVRRELQRYRGREVKTVGDGFLATFDGPGRAVRCGRAIVDEARTLGLEVRAGLHTGECELMEDDVAGVAVHIASRIVGLAAPGEVLASSTVRDLVVGSGIEFVSRGTHALRGVPGEWQVYAAA